MIGFDFGMTAGGSQSNTRKQLEGNAIHTVTFEGCVARDIEGKQDPNKTFKVLDIKFSNKDGYFTDTIWEPTENDMEDRQGPYGAQPSNFKAMMYKFKHLIDAVNPELAKKIDSGEQKLNANTWDGLRTLMVQSTTPGIGKETKIKLIKNNKGEASFPFFANYNKEGKFYMATNFIGDNIFWTSKELNKMNTAASAKPTSAEVFDAPTNSSTSTEPLDFNF